MKNIFKTLFAAAAITVLYTSCEKVDSLPSYSNGTAVVLTSSVATIAPAAADSNNTAVTFTWTDPKYAATASTFKYVLEIDSTGRNFSKAASKVVTGTLTTAMLAKELNSILLGFGFAFNTPYDVDVRVISSYGNNNEQIKSNTLKLRVTPYKIPPKVALPASGKLWANGGACTWSWNGAPPTPESELCRLDNETWTGVFSLAANNEFLVLGQNGGVNPYDQKYAVPNNTVPGISSGGDFGYYPPGTGGDNFKSSAAAGWYIMTMSFQTGKFTVNSFGSNALPQDLYVTGDGVASNWTNSPPAAQRFTRLNSCEYTLTVALIPGKNIKFLSSFGNWQPQFGGTSSSGGTMGANYGSGSDPDAIPTPAAAGTYKITVNFATNTYKITL